MLPIALSSIEIRMSLQNTYLCTERSVDSGKVELSAFKIFLYGKEEQQYRQIYVLPLWKNA